MNVVEKGIEMLNMTELFKGKRRYVIIVGLLCIALLSSILLTDGIKKQDNESITGITYNAQELLKYKTAYVGDNVKVVNLVNKLAYGNSIKAVYLQIKVQPYGVIADYDFSGLKYDKEKLSNSFEVNATIMFAIIGNVDSITFKGEGPNEHIEFTYLRAEVQKKYNVDLREYSKDANMLEQLLESLIFRVSVFPEKYALTMSSTPGIKLSEYYYGTETVEKVRFSTEKGILFNWDTATGKISEGVQTVEIPYGKVIYWSPISKGDKSFEKSDNTITVVFLDGSGKALGEKQVIITIDDSFNYTVKSALDDNQSHKPQSIDEAVRLAIKARAHNYRTGEVAAEGHNILGTEESDKAIIVYTMSSVGNFAFENGIFTKISGSGVIPTVMTFSNEEKDKYGLLEFKEPEDGSGYTDSIKKMFPHSLQEVALSAHVYSADLMKQQEIQAEEYLKSIGRVAKVSVSHVDKKLLDIDTGASNRLFSQFDKYDVFINSCPYWIGTIEQIEGGIRYIYETSQGKTSDEYDIVIFKKTNVDGTVIKEIKYKIVGSEPQLFQ